MIRLFITLTLCWCTVAVAQTTVRGVFRSNETSEPLPGVSIEVDGRAVGTSDEAGAFSLSGIKGSSIRMKARRAGYDALDQVIPVTGPGELQLMLVLYRAAGPGVINGIVRLRDPADPEKRVVAPNVTVAVRGKPPVATDAEGRFTMPEMGPGPVTLQFSGAGLKPGEEVAQVPPNGEAKVEVLLERSGEKVSAVFRGQVRSKRGGALKATLFIKETNETVQSKPDGTFEVQLPGGKYTVTFKAQGFISQTRKVEVEPGDQALFYVNLSPRG